MSEPPYPLHPSIVDRVDPEYAAFYNQHVIDKQQVQHQPISVSRSSGVLIPGAGPLAPVGKTADYTVERVETPGPAIRVRCFTPDEPRPDAGWPVLLYYHGGGWVLGNIDTENVIATNICSRSKCVVVSPDYRLAPEDPFPAAVEDAWEIVQWAIGKGKELLGLDTSRMAVGGSSAGGNLAAVMCQRGVARGGPTFRLQLLSVPVMDNTAEPSNNPSWSSGEHAPALPAAKMMWYRNHYLPDRKDWNHPEASPLFWDGDWSKLPPAVIVVGGIDILRHEGEQFGRKLTEANVRADVHVFEGQAHPFIAMDGVLEHGKRAITYFCEAMFDVMYGKQKP
ncbi:hypothetical protein HIM_01902 [Hirsutella minnesotensis 3608]|nr:hypothetical protein HIM_01902 [Hirsutella minnesotensis 3608]